MAIEKAYNPQDVEQRTYQEWLASGYFNPDNLPRQDRAPFTIMMPPPNATGILHAGHALFLTIQDIFIRHARMDGKRALWVPGTDHAAIATQARVEKDIYKTEGKSRHDLGREELLNRVNAFVEKHRSIITGQMRAMGASCDWSREAFTLDAARTTAVNEAFKRLHDLGLIYRGYRIVNWDPKGQTTISDDEIVYEERTATLYTFRYAKDFPIPIATTRPETKVGDTAVAVHPDDPRYQKYIGSTYDLTFCGVPLHITVVGDAAVDPAFGTGALGVTPAHSVTDWEIAQRHHLDIKPVINEYARMIVGDEHLKNLKTTEARAAIVAWLTAEGLLESQEDTAQNIATAERTGGIVEPLPKLQWFIGVNTPFIIPHSDIAGIAPGQEVTLKQLMRHVVEHGEITVVPERFANTYFHWIDNLRDWCISRQIWFGHRIPVWYKGEELQVNAVSPGDGWEQDSDTLDTWFSSGLWTFSTLGWPNQTRDLATFHPTDMLETAYEILFFWVARMILMTTALLGQIPFKTVYLHGLVRDEKRQKLSKSKSDSADPLDLIARYGTDALRLALVFNTAPGTDSILSEEKIKGMKHFVNKLWNIGRFILLNAPPSFTVSLPPHDQLTDADRAILQDLDRTVRETTGSIESYRLHEAAYLLYHFVWHEFADRYVESSKAQLLDTAHAAHTSIVLTHCFRTILRLLHPFAPFVTEELWKQFGGTTLLMIEPWPTLE